MLEVKRVDEKQFPIRIILNSGEQKFTEKASLELLHKLEIITKNKIPDNQKKKTKNLKFIMDCMLNVQLNKLKEVSEEISLLKHWLIQFEKMPDCVKRQVTDNINERMRKSDFWEDDIFVFHEKEE